MGRQNHKLSKTLRELSEYVKGIHKDGCGWVDVTYISSMRNKWEDTIFATDQQESFSVFSYMSCDLWHDLEVM
jgi:hypothetical protein